MLNISYRQAQIGDELELAEISLNSWKDAFKEFLDKSFLENLSLSKSIDVCKSIINSKTNNQKIILASLKNDNKKIGFINFCHLPGLTQSGERGEVIALHVLKEYQNMGVGKYLFKSALNVLFFEECLSVITWILQDNLKSKNFFEKVGGAFTISGIRNIGGTEYKQDCYLWNRGRLSKI